MRHFTLQITVSFVLIIGVMTSSATGAHAEWRIEGTALGASTAFFLGSGTSTIEVSTTISGTAVKIACSELSLANAEIKEPSELNVRLKFSKCKTFLGSKKEESVPCAPTVPVVMDARGLLFLDSNEPAPRETYVLFEPQAGHTSFGTLELGNSGECSVGQEFEVRGSLVGECKIVSCETESVTHAIEALNEPSLFSDELKIGKSKAIFTGSANVDLGILHAGEQWSGEV